MTKMLLFGIALRYKQGNRLTRRPCKGDEFEILIFEGKRQNADICRSRQKMLATWTFISIGRRVTQEWKFAFRLRGDSILLFKGQKKTFEIYDFQSPESYQGGIHSSSFFLFSTLAVPERLWQIRSHSLQQDSVVTPCPAVGPSVWFFCETSTEVAIFSSVSMFQKDLLSTSNNGSIGFTPQTTWKMVSLSKDMFFVVDLGHLEPFVGIIFVTTGCKTSGSICNENARAGNPHLVIIRQHAQRVHLP